MEFPKAGFVRRSDREAYFAFGWSKEAADFLRKGRFSELVFEGHWGDFGFISEYADFVESIILQNEDRDATGVATLHELKRLVVGAKPGRAVDFAALKKLESCKVPWDKAYLTTLFALPRLKQLTIESFAEANFENVSPSQHLEELTLVRPRIQSLDGIRVFPGLKELDIAYPSKLTDVTEISSLTELVNLRIINAKGLTSFPSKPALKNLETLILGNVSVGDLDFAASLERLRILSVGGEPARADWDTLLRLPHLKRLQVLVSKKDCPSEQQFQQLISKTERGAQNLKLVSTAKSTWVSVQMELAAR